MDLRLNDLRNFTFAAKFETLSAASRGLGITQPALSSSISRLEKDIGTRLFYRTQSGIQLTPQGREHLERCKTIIAEITCLTGKSATQLRIRIGAHPTVAQVTLLAAMCKYSSTHPQVQVELVHAASRDIEGLLHRGLIDLAVVVNPVPPIDLVARKIREDEFTLWIRSKRKRASESSAPSIIGCDPALFQTQRVLRQLKKKPQAIMPSTSLELIARLTVRGYCVGVLPMSAAELVGKGALRQMIGAPSVIDHHYLLYRPEFARNAEQKVLISTICDANSKPSKASWA